MSPVRSHRKSYDLALEVWKPFCCAISGNLRSVNFVAGSTQS